MSTTRLIKAHMHCQQRHVMANMEAAITPGVSTGALVDPADAELNSQLELGVLEMRENEIPVNAGKVFDPKIDECFQCCVKVWPNDLHCYKLS